MIKNQVKTTLMVVSCFIEVSNVKKIS